MIKPFRARQLLKAGNLLKQEGFYKFGKQFPFALSGKRSQGIDNAAFFILGRFLGGMVNLGRTVLAEVNMAISAL